MKILYSILLFLPSLGVAQLPDSILFKVRNATSDFSINYDPVPIAGSNTLPCLEVKINGIGPYKFLIDLGSNVVLFKESVVKESNMEVLVDRASSDVVKANTLEIGGSIFTDVHGGAYSNLDVDGVIGYNLLRNANFYIDYPRMIFSFTRRERSRNDSPYIKYSVIGRMPYLKSRVGEKEYFINFDTGASLWLYFPLRYKDSVSLINPLTEFKQMSNNQTGKVMTYIGQIRDEIVFGNYRIISSYVIFDPDIEDIYVGSSLLNQFKLTFYTKYEILRMERVEKGNLIVIPENQQKTK